MNKEDIRAKRKARKLALQALYQWHMSKADLFEIEAQFRVANDLDKVDSAYFCELLHQIPQRHDTLEEAFIPHLDREIAQLNPIELTVIWIGTYELLNCIELPYRVVLDEAITLAKDFGSQDGYRYVNGVLNGVAKKVRAVEVEMNG